MSDSTRPAGRLAWIDLLRGVAIAMMVVYHFCYDLNYYAYTEFNFNQHPFWLSARTFIVSLFLGLVGVSLQLAHHNGIRWRPYFIRLGLLVVFAIGISLTSVFMFPDTWIFFGILHFIAVASVLGLLFLPLFWVNLALGIVLLVLGSQFSHEWFNQPAWQWLGLVTQKPYTEDYVPLLPWFGVVLIGQFIGKLIVKRPPLQVLFSHPLPAPGGRLLAWSGRHSLLIYVLHQPILMAALFVVSQFWPPA